MNPDVALLVFQYKRGSITPQQFSAEMRQMNYSIPQITQIMADANNPRIREPIIPAPDGTPPVSAASGSGSQPSFSTATPGPGRTAPVSTPAPSVSPAPAAPSRQNYAINTPYYGSDDIPVGSAFNAPLQEDRATRARLADLPSDFGSPAGSMAYPSQLPRNLQPSPMQQAVNVARNVTAPRQASAETRPDAEPSGVASFLRGRFGEAAKGSPMDDRLTAAQIARDMQDTGRASGGKVDGAKGGNKDAALHKALEIIHHMISQR
jgi:hypothetical protein